MNKMQEAYKRLHEMDLDDLVKYTYELEQKVQELKVLEDDIKDNRIAYIDTPEFKEKYISKDKIKDKIEELKKDDIAIASFLDEPDIEFEHIEKQLTRIGYEIDLLKEILESEDICLPYFEENKMYTGMQSDKEYTLEELGL